MLSKYDDYWAKGEEVNAHLSVRHFLLFSFLKEFVGRQTEFCGGHIVRRVKKRVNLENAKRC